MSNDQVVVDHLVSMGRCPRCVRLAAALRAMIVMIDKPESVSNLQCDSQHVAPCPVVDAHAALTGAGDVLSTNERATVERLRYFADVGDALITSAEQLLPIVDRLAPATPKP